MYYCMDMKTATKRTKQPYSYYQKMHAFLDYLSHLYGILEEIRFNTSNSHF